MSKIGSSPSPNSAASVQPASPPTVEGGAVQEAEAPAKPPTLGEKIQQNQFQAHSPSITGSQLSTGRGATPQASTSTDPDLQRQLRSSLAAAQAAGGSQLARSQQPGPTLSPSLPENLTAAPSGLSGGTGALGLDDPNVTPARAHARSVEGQQVQWNQRGEILNNMSQIDSNQGTQANGNDAVRCGAAGLVAGGVLTGPENFQQGLGRLHNRGEQLLHQLENTEGIQQLDGTTASLNDVPAEQRDGIRNTLAAPLRRSLSTVEELQGRDPSTLTHGDLQRLQEATYQIAILDQRTNSDGNYSMALEAGQNMPDTPEAVQEALNNGNAPTQDPYLTTGTLQTYRDLMWGSERPQMEGRNLDLNWVSNDNNGGHFVLADTDGGANGRSVAYNPWPEADGTAYSRSVDGAGVRIRPMSEATSTDQSYLRGMDIDDPAASARRLPSRH
ncbi:MAG: hypothetical protein EP343_24860 [Deltaproteobacteria bacterium]|nr:MAG: hypothetical protein EP343_24860 [Deltaproteobacteria bacterium]